MVNGNLPDGWSVKRLIDVGQLLRGVSYRKEDSSDKPQKGFVPILRATNIQSEKLILDDEIVYVPSSYVRAEQYLKPNDIVVCMSSGSKHLVGKTAQLGQEWNGSFGTFCAAIRPKEIISSKFLGYFFSSPYYRDFIREKSAGININNLKPSDFEAIEIPVAPLPEQERIVARIEELITQLEAGTSALAKVQAGLRRYKASVLKAAVEGKLVGNIGVENSGELPKGWRWVKVEDLAADERYSLAIGPFGSNLKVVDYRDKGVPLVFVRHIRTASFDETHYVTKEKAEELRAHQIAGGDVLITKMGEPPGDACLYPETKPMAVITADCIKWRVAEGLADKRFIVHAINSPVLQKQVEKITRGVAQKKVSLDRFRGLSVPLPPLEEQRQIVAEVERRLSVARQVEAAVKVALARASRLRQAVLKSAFEGKL